jgi:prepilin-type N-terminal cleavage/methylation domain-containing protein
MAFTLVELIVVVTILAILATIGFVSYSSYLTWVRDTNRLAQLVSIHDWLELYRTRNDLPLPDESIDVIIWVETIAYQWYAGSNTLETIDFTKGWLDPRDKSYFSYYLTAERK